MKTRPVFFRFLQRRTQRSGCFQAFGWKVAPENRNSGFWAGIAAARLHRVGKIAPVLFYCGLTLILVSACQPVSHSPTQTPILVQQITVTATQSLTPSQTPIPTSTPTIRPSSTATASRTPSPTASLIPQGLSTLGVSTQQWPLEVYRFGDGPTNLVFIGGIHGGYEWNTILLAYEMISYFQLNQDAIPPEVSCYIIPASNPDGQVQVVGHSGVFLAEEVGADTIPGRFNGAGVDLNRNWDCNWSPTGTWLDRDILTGSEPFSEVENRLLRDFLLALPADGVVFWHSAAFGVYAGGCGDIYEPAIQLAKTYTQASGYPFKESFTSYVVTGDATDWLSLVEIPAITVELENHYDLDWEENLKGVLAVLKEYSSRTEDP